MPDPGECRWFANYFKSTQLIELGRAQEALELINANFQSEYMGREDFRDWKYEHLFYKGSSLTRLAKCNEALGVFDAANVIQADGKFETDILVARSNCLMALERYEEGFEVASRVTSRDDAELAALALQYMAECRMYQGRVPEALAIYLELHKKLPSKHVDEQRIQREINRAIAFLEKNQSQRRLF
jgi:tetratricopeptide (TPR) repeat protein